MNRPKVLKMVDKRYYKYYYMDKWKKKEKERGVIVICPKDKSPGREREIERMRQYLKEMFDEKGEIDREMLELSQKIDRLIAEETQKRTKKA